MSRLRQDDAGPPAAAGPARGAAGRVPPGVGLLAGVLLTAGVLHLVAPRPYDAIMPAVLPEPTHRPLTYASGLAEIACAVLLLVPRTRRTGGRLTTALLLLVLPANVQAALAGGYPIDGPLGTPLAAWLRVPLQVPLIVWSRWVTRTAGGERT